MEGQRGERREANGGCKNVLVLIGNARKEKHHVKRGAPQGAERENDEGTSLSEPEAAKAES